MTKCKVCKREFESKCITHIFCSKRCRDKNYRQKHHEHRKRVNLKYYYKHRKLKREANDGRTKKSNYRKEYFRKRKKFFIDVLGGKCEKCGYSKCISALEFHHVNPEEKEEKQEWKRNLNQFMRKIKDGKIRLLCANCHREKHNPF